MKRLMMLCLCLLLAGGAMAQSGEQKIQTGTAAPSPEKLKLVQEFFEASGMKAQMKEGLVMQMEVLRQNPNVPPRFLELFGQRLSLDELMNRLAPSYASFFNEEELKALVAFHNSPVGKRLASVNGELMEAVKKVGEEYGREVGEAVAAEMQANSDH